MESAQHSNSVKFQVIVTGVKDDSSDGRKQLRENFAAKFKLAPEKVEKLLSKLPATVKVEPERVRADRWIPILEGLGAVASVRQVGEAQQITMEEPAEKKVEKAAAIKGPLHSAEQGVADTLANIESSSVGTRPASTTHELSFVESEPAATEEETKQAAATADEHFQLTNLMQLVGDNAAPRFVKPVAPAESKPADGEVSLVSSTNPPESPQVSSNEEGSEEQSKPVEPEQAMGKMESFIPRVSFTPASTKLPSRKFISICAGGSVAFLLALAGIMAFGPAPSAIELSSNDIKKLLGDQKKILAGKAAPDQSKVLDQQLSKASEYTGDFNSGPYSGKLAVKVDGDRILTLSMELTGRASEKLTPELLIAGRKRSPWLAKLEVPVIKADLARLDLPPLTISGIGKAYLDDDAGSARYAADLYAVGKPGLNPDQMVLTIVISNNAPIQTSATEIKIERLKGDRFSFVIPLEATVSRKVPLSNVQQAVIETTQPVPPLAAQTSADAAAMDTATAADGPLPIGDIPAAQ